ncbi:MAG: amidohydrolase [Anaerolineae bacterium]|nr:amidohydrolase [Anaerolineae bacterium]
MINRLIVNAKIYTLDAEQPAASALAISRDRIVAVGGDELRTLATKQTQIDDLQGATVIPGLIDAHIHWEWTSRSLRDVDLFAVPSKQEAVERVGKAAANVKQGGWLLGRGWAQAMWEGGAFPTAADLDAVTGNIPTFLNARSGHGAWVNSAALKLAGITDSTPDPKGGLIQRDEHGKATGILLEDAIGLVSKLVPDPTAAELADMMEDAQKLAWQAGLTGLHDFDNPSAFEAMQILHEQGRLGLRIVKNINAPFIQHAYGLRLRSGFGDDWLRIGALKIFADGALGTRTALMIAPYEGEPENYGVVVTDPEEMIGLVSEASRRGLASTIHAIGDKAVHEVLNVFETVRDEEAARGVHPSERRHRIEHVQLIHPDDVGRLAALDIIASMQPIHATADYQMADQYWGTRSAFGYNPRLQIGAGAQVAFGSDSPVEPFDPIKGIHAAVTRRREDGTPRAEGWYPEAKITMEETLRGYTQGAAYAGGMEDRQGRIAVGYFADVVALDRDLVTGAPDDILKTKVIGTMVGGVWNHYTLK